MFFELHQEVLCRLGKMNTAIAEVIETLNKIESTRAYREGGYSSMWSYVTVGLNISEALAQQVLSVARKSIEVPEVRVAVETGRISLNKVALIVNEITPQNQVEWLTKASEMKTRELKQELAKVRPKALPMERITVRTENVVEVKLGMHKDTLARLERAKDLLCQKNRRVLNLEEVISQLAESYLEKNDPEVKAQKALCTDKVKPKPVPQGRIPLPAWVQHTIQAKYQNQCAKLLPNGQRCPERKFLEMHHIIPLSEGGSNQPENLILLCSGHHKGNHLPHLPKAKAGGSSPPISM